MELLIIDIELIGKAFQVSSLLDTKNFKEIPIISPEITN